MLMAYTTTIAEKPAKMKKVKIEKDVKQGTEMYISYNHDDCSIFVYMATFNNEGVPKETRYTFKDDDETREMIAKVHEYFEAHPKQPSIGEAMFKDFQDRQKKKKKRKTPKSKEITIADLHVGKQEPDYSYGDMIGQGGH